MTGSKDENGVHLSLSSSAIVKPGRTRTTQAGTAVSHLDGDDVAELRTAVERSLRAGEMHDASSADIDVDLRKSLRIACAKARLQRVRAEQLVVDLKQLWMTIPMVTSTRTEERLHRIVSACIDEYYAEDSPPQS